MLLLHYLFLVKYKSTLMVDPSTLTEEEKLLNPTSSPLYLAKN